MTERIYKICGQAEWQAAVDAGIYTGSVDDVRDGFIHFSLARQLAATAAKYFAARTDLVLVAVEIEQLGAALRFEASREGDLFPHLYAPLSIGCVLWTAALAWDGAAHRWPPEVGAV